jgi:hypothetical protein
MAHGTRGNLPQHNKTSLLVMCLFHKSISISALGSLRAVSALLPITKSTMWMTSRNSRLAHYSMSKTIEVVDTIVMPSRVMHGQPISSECVVVEVTMVREGHQFEDLDYPDEEEVIEKLKDAKGNFIL